MKIQIFSAAVGLLAISTTVAFSMPLAKLSGAGDLVTQIAKKDDGKSGKEMKHMAKNNSGDRSKLYAKWHKMDKRPADWRNKACVTAGDVWYCP